MVSNRPGRVRHEIVSKASDFYVKHEEVFLFLRVLPAINRRARRISVIKNRDGMMFSKENPNLESGTQIQTSAGVFPSTNIQEMKAEGKDGKWLWCLMTQQDTHT